MTDKLIILDAGPECYRIAWWLSDEQETGAILGVPLVGGNGEEPDRSTDREEWEWWKAEDVASSLGAEKDEDGYFWESKRLVKSALVQIEAGLRQQAPWPDWARAAVENGWKAPKGWRP